MSRSGRLLRRIVQASCARPALTLGVGIALAAASVGYALSALALNTSQRALLPARAPYIQRSIEYDHEFAQPEKLVIAVEAPSVPEAKAYASRLVRELRARQAPLRRIMYRVDPKQFEGQALLYLSKQRLSEIRDQVFDHQDFMEAFASRPTLDQLVEGIAEQIAREFVTGFFDLGLTEPKGVADLHFIQSLVAQISERLDRPARYRSPWGAFFPDEGADESSAGYFFSDDERLLFVLAEPESDSGSFTDDRRAIDGTRALIASLRGEFPDVKVGVTGRPALSNDEMTSAFRDSRLATVLAFVLTLGLLLAAFRRLGKPLLMLAVLTLSLCWSIGVATLGVGHLSLFSVMFISIVIGIGIDYGIYYLFRYEEELYLGRSLNDALETTAARTGPGMLVGALTAAGTFYVLMLTDFRGLQELGFIAGSAILLSWLSMMTVFPAILVLVDRRHATPPPSIPRALALERVRMPFVDRLTGHPKTVAALGLLLTVVALWGLRAVRFDYDLLNLQAKGTESVIWERRILATAGRSDFVALSRADSLEDLRHKQAMFRRLPSVAEVDSVLVFVPEDQGEKRKIIGEFAPLVTPIRIGRPRPADVDRLIEGLTTLQRRLSIGATEAPPGKTQRELRSASEDTSRLLEKLRRLDRDVSEPALTHLQTQLYDDFVRGFHRLQANLSPRPISPADVPPETRRQWVSDRGGYLLEIHPAVDIWDRAGAGRFVGELRSVDPAVTGPAVITFEAIRAIERAYRQGTIYAIVLVSIVGLAVLRRIRETALALLPLGLGLTWTVGLMGLLGLTFTMGNVFALPLILGAAAEYGLNVVLRFMEDRARGGPLVARSTVMAVLVNGLTTISGFGSLMVADHRGIFGLGVLLTLGTAASLVAALVVLPVLLRMIRRPLARVSVGEDRSAPLGEGERRERAERR